MTSKEALRRIKREAGTPYFSAIYDIDMWREDFKTIADDLDMLELIKKHLLRVPSIGPNGNEYNDIILVMPNDYVEEAKKIERWLLQQWEAEKKKSKLEQLYEDQTIICKGLSLLEVYDDFD